MREQQACAIASWETVLRAAEQLRFTRVVPWGCGLWFVQWNWVGAGRLSRDIVVDGEHVWTKAEADV